MTDQPTLTKSRFRRSLPALVGAVLTVVCVGFIVRTMSSEWGRVHDKLVHASLAWVAASLGFGALGMAVVAWTWADAVRVAGGRMRRRQALSWYFVGELGKYLPGAIWAAVGRGELARRNGIPRTISYPSVGLSLIGLYLAAALTAAVLVPFDLAHQSHAGPALLLLLLVPVGLACLHPTFLGWLRDGASKITRKPLDVAIPAWRDTVTLVLRYVPAWAAISAATWCVARALPGVDAPVLRIALATVLSWAAGFVTPTPAGAGVRETVFIAVSGLATGPAVAVAVASRLVFVLVDVGGALLGLPGSRPRARTSVSVSSHTADPTVEPAS